MATIIGGISVALGLDSAQVLLAVKKTRSSFRNLELSIKRNAEALVRSVKSILNPINLLKSAVAILGGPAAVGYATARIMDHIDAQAKLAQQLGVTIKTVGAYSHLADLSGVSTSEFANAIKTLDKNTADLAQKGVSRAAQSFRVLGIEQKDLVGIQNDSIKILELVADKFSLIKDGATKTAAAMKIFGDTKILPALKGGSEAIRKTIEEAELFGVAISDNMAKRVEEANDQITRIKNAVMGFAQNLVGSLAPAITLASTKLLDFIKEVIESRGGIRNFAKDAAIAVLDFVETALTGLHKFDGMLGVIASAMEKIGVLSRDSFDVTQLKERIALEDKTIKMLSGILESGQANALQQQQLIDLNKSRNSDQEKLTKLINEENAARATGGSVLYDMIRATKQLKEETEAAFKASLSEPSVATPSAPTSGGNPALASGIEQDAIARRDAMQKNAEALRVSFASDLVLEMDYYQQRANLISQAENSKTITQEEANAFRLEAKRVHEEKLTEIEEDEWRKRALISKNSLSGQIRDTAQLMATMTSDAIKKSRTMFNINKVASIANTLISTYDAAQNAYRSASVWGGAAAGAAAAGLALTAGFMRVNAIKNTTFGSTSAGVASAGGGGGGGVGAADASSQPQQSAQQTPAAESAAPSLIFNVHGSIIGADLEEIVANALKAADKKDYINITVQGQRAKVA